MNHSVPQLPSHLALLIEQAPVEYSAPRHEHQAFVQRAAETILAESSPAEAESILLEQRDEIPLALHLAAKLAKSREVVAKLTRPVLLDVVFAAYKENHRLLTPDEHSSGEDFLRRKVAQLKWLAEASPHLRWRLTAVDDGCPDGSGDLIENLARKEEMTEVSVLRLADAIREKLPIAGDLSSTDESRKGGSILYGMWEASRSNGHEGDHVILFTDADLSTHLGQAGLLLDPILNGAKDVAIGSRRESTSVVVKQGTRNVRGKLFIYLWKRMLSPALGKIVDTQCGFKAFRAQTAQAILDDFLERGFAFDIELLLKSERLNPDGIAKAPIAWIDSEAESTTTALSPYLAMLRSIAAMSRKYLPANESGQAFVKLVESLDEDRWNHLVEHVPVAIADGDPLTFGEFAGVTPDDLRALLDSRED